VLGLVQGGVRHPQQILGPAAVLGKGGHADGDGHPPQRGAQVRQHLLLDPLAQLLGLRPRVVQGRAGQHHQQLLAAHPAGHVPTPGLLHQEVAEGPQDHVAGVVAERIVEALEVVDVDGQEHRASRWRSGGSPTPVSDGAHTGRAAMIAGTARGTSCLST
jgi:hypothetical protein